MLRGLRRGCPVNTVLGFDPGQSGAIAAVDHGGNLLWVEDMPVIEKVVSARLLWQILARHDGVFSLAVIENVHSMPKQGVASSFKFGRSKGVIEGCVAALGCPTELPTPSGWKKDMRLSRDKDAGRAVAVELWPEHAELFKRKKDADRAEAALMAEWGRRLLVERGRAA